MDAAVRFPYSVSGSEFMPMMPLADGSFVCRKCGHIHRVRASNVTYFMDRVFLSRLSDLVCRATGAFENYEHHIALAETERFFWKAFTDTFIEMIRARTHGALGAEAQVSAISALHLALNVLLRLFAPFLP